MPIKPGNVPPLPMCAASSASRSACLPRVISLHSQSFGSSGRAASVAIKSHATCSDSAATYAQSSTWNILILVLSVFMANPLLLVVLWHLLEFNDPYPRVSSPAAGAVDGFP